jgi:AraC family transcriptional regulator, transcriptional activator of pobA
MKKKPDDIDRYQLDASFHQVHKEGRVASDFGLDSTQELVGGGFGLYSSAGLKPKIGPIKSEFFRAGFGLQGSVHLECGLETHFFQKGDMVFTFPGQVFSMQDKSPDFSAYYMLFSEEFVADAMSLKNIREQFPFLHYGGAQHIQLDPQEAAEVEHLILKINSEIKQRKPDLRQAIQLYLHLVLIQAKRSYERQQLGSKDLGTAENALLRRYKKLVGEHFVAKRNVSDYAALLHVSADHLSKTVRKQSGKTAHQLIEEMLLMEAKALLLHTEASVAEIAWRLEFADPSHFNKFFKKLTEVTPQQYRGRA